MNQTTTMTVLDPEQFEHIMLASTITHPDTVWTLYDLYELHKQKRKL